MGVMWYIVWTVLLMVIVNGEDPTDSIYYGQFPDEFVWGAGTTAYQVEGAYKTGGRGYSIWDTFSQSRGKILNDENGDIACDSYDKYKEDVQLIKKMGLRSYRFSISWSRVFPRGTNDTVNIPGVAYYQNLVTELVTNKIEPVVTLYHWDLPQALQDVGGWQNDTIVDSFGDYAQFMFQQLGDQVKYWITLDDLYSIAWNGYGSGLYAPGINEPATAPYQVGHNLIRAHVKAYHIYDTQFRATQTGKIGVALNSEFFQPKTSLQPDIDAAERDQQFVLGWFANPILGVTGDYPEVMKEYIDTKSTAQGLAKSRLPTFTLQEKRQNNGSADFLGISHYTTRHVSNRDGNLPGGPSYLDDKQVTEDIDPSWKRGGTDGLVYVPWGMREVLKWVKNTYNNPPVFITENGMADCGTTEDEDRINFYTAYINNVLKAIKLDHCNVKGFFARSLLDGFEWTRGYADKYGLVKVDFDKPDRPRTMKASAYYYTDLVDQNGFSMSWTRTYVNIDQQQQRSTFLTGTFPEDFAWGATSSAFKVEGASLLDGKGISIWDIYSHQGKTVDHENADVACDSYHKYKIDTQMLRQLGVSHYSLSFSWTRLMPSGTLNSLSANGVKYYNDVINDLVKNNIRPIVTLYDMDTPEYLQVSAGGWTNRSMIHYFNDYARTCFSKFGDRVKMWITMSEPYKVTWLGYGNAQYPPGTYNPAHGGYNTAHNVIRAHVMAYHTYVTEFRVQQKGQVGIALDSEWKEPNDFMSDLDKSAADRALQFKLGWFANPIFGNGDYPEVMKTTIASKSIDQGFAESRLPTFSPEEIAKNRGSADFFGLNHFTTNLVSQYENTDFPASYAMDQDIDITYSPCWNKTSKHEVRVNPWGLRSLLQWITNRYGAPPIYVTENGMPDTGQVDDDARILYLRGYINEVLKAVTWDKINVKGYMVRSLMDSFEWNDGYTVKYGLYYVDFNSTERSRSLKSSAWVYKEIVQNNGFMR